MQTQVNHVAGKIVPKPDGEEVEFIKLACIQPVSRVTSMVTTVQHDILPADQPKVQLP